MLLVSCSFDDFFRFEKKILCVLEFQPISLLCIVGKLAGGGSLAVAVGVSDR